MSKFLEAIYHPEKIIIALGRKTTLIPDKLYLKAYYKNIFGRKLNLKNPKTFNEKLQWLKLNDRNPKYTVMVDKYEAKRYVANIIGGEYIIPTYGVWDSFDDINFESLPKQFVLKCTHDSSGVIIVKDKANFDKSKARQKMSSALKRNFYCSGREWPYKNVPPRIIAEKYLEDTEASKHTNCKFMCFGGTAKCNKLDLDRFKKKYPSFISGEKSFHHISDYPYCTSAKSKETETRYTSLNFVKTLAQNKPVFSADFYDVNEIVYFGKLKIYANEGIEISEHQKVDFQSDQWMNDSVGNCVFFTKDFIILLKKKETDLKDYKIHCFNGKPEIILVCSDRFSESGMKEDFFDVEWNRLNIKRPHHENSHLMIEKPRTLNTMLELARTLSQNIPFVRVDFYSIKNKVFFGELTFYPASGLEKFEPPETDLEFGNLLQLNIS